jgi:DNA-binding MarR family transcriptional regulator
MLTSREYSILKQLAEASRRFNELCKAVNLHPEIVKRELGRLSEEKLVNWTADGSRRPISITRKGKDRLASARISNDAEKLGLAWIEERRERGFIVRYLSDLTEIPKHREFLFAWNPRTRETELAEIFGVRNFDMNNYFGQYVDRGKKPDGPIRMSHLQPFLKEEVKDFNNTDDVSAALKKFYNLETHNSFFGAMAGPSEGVSFGFPDLIGNFSAGLFYGLGYQVEWPFVGKTSAMLGKIQVPNLADFEVTGFLNFNKLYEAAIALFIAQGDPTKEEAVEKLIREAFKVEIKVTAKKLSLEGGPTQKIERVYGQ